MHFGRRRALVATLRASSYPCWLRLCLTHRRHCESGPPAAPWAVLTLLALPTPSAQATESPGCAGSRFMTVEPDAERANALCAASAKTTGHRYAAPARRPAMASTSPHELCVPTAAPAASLLSHAHLHSTRPPLRVHRPRCAPVQPGRMWSRSQVSRPHRTIELTDPVRFYVPNPLITDTVSPANGIKLSDYQVPPATPPPHSPNTEL